MEVMFLQVRHGGSLFYRTFVGEKMNCCMPMAYDIRRMKNIIVAVICLATMPTLVSAACVEQEPAAPLSVEWVVGTVVSEAELKGTPAEMWFRAEEISDEVFARMWLRSWKRECPLRRSDLRYLKMLYCNADGKPQRGEMVVSVSIAEKVLRIFRRLYEAGYRIERMELIDNYMADDETAMRANNSSAFNFRFMTGSTIKVSKHGLGLAIDINPLYNPYVKRKANGMWHIEPSTAKPYAFDRDRREDIPCKISHEDLAYKLFKEEGFEWGGDWNSLKDYQHFEYNQ